MANAKYLRNNAVSHFLCRLFSKESPIALPFVQFGNFRTGSVNTSAFFCARLYAMSVGFRKAENDVDYNIKNNGNLRESKFIKMRTHTCGSLNEKNIGSSVRICGWLQFSRMSRFAILRDSYGLTQVVIPDERKELSEKLVDTPLESIIAVEGKVVLRPEGQENPNLSTGKIEVLVDDLLVLNPAKKNLPFSIREYSKAKESLQMKYRYLSLRFPELQHNLRLRSHMVNLMRKFLIKECAFVEVETPTLFRRTPGGAQEFCVPTQRAGHFYSLVQSPQQLKQILMVGAIDRYFQVARCYRDESARPDRQPEFTQLDIEMSFSSREDVMDLVEELLVYSWHSCIGKSNHPPFQRLSYNEALSSYGTDKPDMRFEMKLMNITETLKACDSKVVNIMKCHPSFVARSFVVPKAVERSILSKSVLKSLEKIIQKTLVQMSSVHIVIEKASELTNIQEYLAKLSVDSGDWIISAVGEKPEVLPFLGRFRLCVADYLESKGIKVRHEGFSFLWVEDFPLFLPAENENKEVILESSHHPFTQPHPDDLHLLETQPLKVRGLHYDLVCNGSEIGGGSVRIHDADLQCSILDRLGIDKKPLSHLIEALGSGCPPHAGIALGLDRVVALAVGAVSVREVMAFPKGSDGQDIMSGSPSSLSKQELDLYHISIKSPDIIN